MGHGAPAAAPTAEPTAAAVLFNPTAVASAPTPEPAPSSVAAETPTAAPEASPTAAVAPAPAPTAALQPLAEPLGGLVGEGFEATAGGVVAGGIDASVVGKEADVGGGAGGDEGPAFALNGGVEDVKEARLRFADPIGVLDFSDPRFFRFRINDV